MMANASQPEGAGAVGTAGCGEESRAGTPQAPTRDPSCIPAILGYLELPQVLLELPGDKEMLKLQVWKGRGCRSLSRWLPSQFLHNNSFFLFPSQCLTHGQATILG